MPKARNAERSDFEVEGITEIRLDAEHIKCRTAGVSEKMFNVPLDNL